MLSRFQEMEFAPDIMVLPMNAEIKEICEIMFSEIDLGERSTENCIVQYLLMSFVQNNVFKVMAYGKNITVNRIELALEDFEAENEELKLDRSREHGKQNSFTQEEDFLDVD